MSKIGEGYLSGVAHLARYYGSSFFCARACVWAGMQLILFMPWYVNPPTSVLCCKGNARAHFPLCGWDTVVYEGCADLRARMKPKDKWHSGKIILFLCSVSRTVVGGESNFVRVKMWSWQSARRNAGFTKKQFSCRYSPSQSGAQATS